MCLTQNLSVQLARTDIKEAYVFEPESDESLTKGMVNQSRREGNAFTEDIGKTGWPVRVSQTRTYARSFLSGEYSVESVLKRCA